MIGNLMNLLEQNTDLHYQIKAKMKRKLNSEFGKAIDELDEE